MDLEGDVHARHGQEAQAALGPAYLVFFVRDPVDDALAEAVVDRVRSCPGAGWFDDPDAATPGERTTGGYVRCGAPGERIGQALLDAARDVSAAHRLVVEVQWREAVVGHLDAGIWRS